MRELPIALLLTALLFLAPACSREKPEASPAGALAALDFKKALAAHDLYPGWQTAVNNESALLKRKAEQTGLLKTRTAAAGEIEALDEAGLESFRQAGLTVQISELRLAERARLDGIEREEKRRIAENLQKALIVIEEEYRLPLFNLKTNIEAIVPLPRRREESRAQKERLLAVLEELQAEKNAKINALYEEAQVSLRQVMKDQEEASALRIRKAAENLRQGGNPADGGARRPDTPENIYAQLAALEKELTEQRIAKDRLYARMYQDIASQAARVAVQSKYAAVLTDVKINIAAADITDEVIAGLPKNK
ncbi:MAG: hypothetical protein LBP78_01660 [Acidaminococcales bacterium]|jgi:hypothetical protein|nr:hypothetical protein [Acidaminococcales bacterium]